MTLSVDDILKIITALTPLVLAILAWQSNQNKQQSKANGAAIAATADKVSEMHSVVVGQADPTPSALTAPTFLYQPLGTGPTPPADPAPKP